MSKAKKVNPKGKYIIYSNHDGLPEKKSEMIFVSIDPGELNFAIRVEKRTYGKKSRHNKIETLTMSKHILSTQRTKNGLGTNSPFILLIHKTLNRYRKYYPDCSVVIVEDQMFVNEPMAQMKATILSYFVAQHPHICVLAISARLKNTLIETEKVSRAKFQKLEVEKAFELSEERGDEYALEILKDYAESDEKTDKVHDLAVTVNQLAAFCGLVGYQ